MCLDLIAKKYIFDVILYHLNYICIYNYKFNHSIPKNENDIKLNLLSIFFSKFQI